MLRSHVIINKGVYMYKKCMLFFLIIVGLIISVGCAQEESHQNEKEHRITLEPEPAEGGKIEGEGVYPENKEVAVEAKPTENYTFSSWIEEGETVSYDKLYRFTLRENRHLKALFEKEMLTISLFFADRKYTDSGTPGPHGYVTPISREIKPVEDVEKRAALALKKLLEGPTPEEESEKNSLR